MNTSLEDILQGGNQSEAIVNEAVEPSNEQEQPSQHEDDGGEEQQSSNQSQGGDTVPVAALRAEREKSKRYTEVLSDLERRLAENDQRWEQRVSQMAEMFNKGQPQEAPQEAADPLDEFFSNPSQFIAKAQQPIVNEYQQRLYQQAREIAGIKHTSEKVDEAAKAYDQACFNGTIDVADAQRIRASHNPFSSAVEWYEKNRLVQEIGSNPEEYRQRLRAEIEAEIAQNNGQLQRSQPANVFNKGNMPSNFASERNAGTRSRPAWGGATPLNEILR